MYLIRTNILPSFILFVALNCLACSSTKDRIQQRITVYDTLPVETQAQIQNGRIDQGFSEDMVFMALGEPSETSTLTRKDLDGTAHQITLWKYKSNLPAAANMSGPGSLSGSGYPTPGQTANTPARYERKMQMVEFEQGKVVRWDADN